ncbi:hypothetical protein ACFFUP_13040 [Vibrio ostreicida]|uniref:GNAT family N-acetyltransferase n=1 Tax=Vibrio ostreicida TaxID=526588 RepID=A0ABT8BZK9_9VIBR|nr:hypothetical protein [Vibrio ostreicida]MDN3611542.1 hypothetical protein [Vibrio ostreicida]NPD09036.1 hypothetical protein [Vibrio ostreicida]
MDSSAEVIRQAKKSDYALVCDLCRNNFLATPTPRQFHHRRKDKHTFLYVVESENDLSGMILAKAVETGNKHRWSQKKLFVYIEILCSIEDKQRQRKKKLMCTLSHWAKKRSAFCQLLMAQVHGPKF